MTLTERVFAQALVLAGELEERQNALLKVLCRSACSELSEKLRSGLTPEDCLADFVSAACLMALAALSEAGEPEQVESFTAGDVSVRKKHSSAAANCLRYQARVMMAPYVRESFSFLGV
jgi:hypothetical protein